MRMPPCPNRHPLARARFGRARIGNHPPVPAMAGHGGRLPASHPGWSRPARHWRSLARFPLTPRNQ